MLSFVPMILRVIWNYFLFHRTVRILIVLSFILSTAAVIIYNNLKNPFVQNIDELQKQLITTSGIFTALMLTILMPKFSERGSERKILISEYEKECKRLAAFRYFIYFMKHFNMFRSSSQLQIKYLKDRSFLDYKASAEFDNELWELLEKGEVKGEDIGRMELFGAIRDFSFEAETGGISFYNNYAEYTYSLEKLEYLQQCCNSIWYSLDKNHYLRDDVRASYSFENTASAKRMENLIPFFSKSKKGKPKDIADFIMSQTGDYDQIIGVMINKLNKILYDLSPKIFSSISIDTIFIIAFGLLIPLYTLLFATSKSTSELLGLICFSVTTTFIISFLVDTYLFFNKDSYKEQYEEEPYDLYPSGPY